MQPPASATNNTINMLGVGAAVSAFLLCAANKNSGVEAALASAGAYAAVVLALEVIFLRTPWRASVGLDYSRRDTDMGRIILKLLGLYATYGVLALLYWLFPEYHGSLLTRGFYTPFWEAVKLVMPYVLLLAVPYMIFMDERMREPKDAYWHFGMLLTGRACAVDWGVLRQHALSWLVKGFFLPLMFVSYAGNMNYLMNLNLGQMLSGFMGIHKLCVDILFTLDLLAAVAGYACALRLFDTHIRSAEPTVGGWFVCILCYPPFLSVFINLYLAYGPNNWGNWLKDEPALLILWGSASLGALVVYTAASLNFGCRFSNLTHRGVLTNGMYRFTKHPAYVSKNLFWWMTYVPFAPMVSGLESLRFCLLLLGINIVYYLRARTEERHLSRDPDYVRYALAMNERSVFKPVAALLPFLRYKAPEGWEKLPKPYMGLK